MNSSKSVNKLLKCIETSLFSSSLSLCFTSFLLLFSSLSSRYKNVERLAAEEFERDRVRVSRTRPDLNLNFEPSEAWPSSSRSSTPSSFASQEDAEADLESGTPATPNTPSETGRTTENTV